MKPILKDIHSPNIYDFDHITEIDQSRSFCVPIQAFFGLDGDVATDSFSFLFCNGDYLKRKVEENGFIVGRLMIVVDQLSREIIEKALISIAEQIEGTDWTDVANKLNRYGQWEFEDYRPFQEEQSP